LIFFKKSCTLIAVNYRTFGDEMKRLTLVLAVFFVIALFAPVYAGTFEDVPRSHWAYDAIEKLQSKGVMLGYVDGTFKGNKTLSRYALSVLVAKMLANVEQAVKSGSGQVTIEDVQLLESLAFEFADELSLLGTNVNSLFSDLNEITEEVAVLKHDTELLKKQTTERHGKVQLGGIYRLLHEDAIKTGTPGDNVHTSGELELQASIQASEKVSAEFCWHMFMQDFGNRNMTNTSSVGGSVTASNFVDVAYIHIEDLAKGNMKFGRDLYTHGHALVLNDHVDAVSYQREVGELELTLNLIYDRQNGIYANTSNDFHHIWNLNLDAVRAKRDFYMGYYKQTQKDDINAAGAVFGDLKNVSKEIVEFGSKGIISRKAHMNYDLGFVHSTSKMDQYGATWVGLKDEGFMQHYALKWHNPKNKVALKVAYTDANGQFDGIIALDNDKYAYDDPYTPFDDLERITGGINNNFANTKDLKLQAEYFPNNDKHYLRLAFDKLEDRKTNPSSDFIKAGLKDRNALGYNKLDTDVTTLEYSYKYRPNTRIRAGYTAADNSSSRDNLNNRVADEKLLWTEIFSSF
jgi:hypothetical protein